MSTSEHIKEIDRVLGGAATGRDAVVLESWTRCVEVHGLDPTRPNPAHIVTATKLREHREQSERLIAIARSGLKTLFRQVVGQKYVLLLADQKGVTVDYFGDPSCESALRDAGLYLGSDWSEDIAGTCGVGSCIVTGEAMTIHQTDHFDVTHTPLSCTVAPIFDTNGLLSAVLDISLLRSPQPKVSQSLALQLVKASARRIELANLMAMMRSEWVLRFSHMPELLDVDPEAAVALDGSGNILGMTNGAARILGRATGIDWRHGEMFIGQRLSSFFELTIDDLPNVTRAKPTEERVIYLRDGSALFGHAICPQRSAHALISARSGLPAPLQALSGDDPEMRLLERKAAKLASGAMPILILGETGVGKERLARAIHATRNKGKPFVPVNCAAIPEALMEAELFGSTGTHGPTRHGLIETANGGMLFLDEIGDMPSSVQSRLLRFLSEGEVQPLGSHMPLKLNIKVISTSHRDIEQMVSEGRFRQDLFFRLAATTLAIPPLRERRDFDWLLDQLLRQRTVALPDVYRFTTAARMELKHRSWPGNIRELINTIDVAVALSATEVIELEDLPAPALSVVPVGNATENDSNLSKLETVLKICGWNISRAARRLGVNRSTVHRRMKRLGIQRPD